MTLADSIRKGAEHRPQAFGRFFRLGEDSVLRSCALGAAFEGTFGATDCEESYLTELRDAYPWLCEAGNVVCPASGCTHALPLSVLGAVGHLNDAHCWEREQIAEWLVPIEEQWSGTRRRA